MKWNDTYKIKAIFIHRQKIQECMSETSNLLEDWIYAIWARRKNAKTPIYKDFLLILAHIKMLIDIEYTQYKHVIWTTK